MFWEKGRGVNRIIVVNLLNYRGMKRTRFEWDYKVCHNSGKQNARDKVDDEDLEELV